MYENKFAVTQIIKNKETILKYFDSKDEACSFGQTKAKSIDKGVIAVIQADFDKAGKMRDKTCSVYEIFEGE